MIIGSTKSSWLVPFDECWRSFSMPLFAVRSYSAVAAKESTVAALLAAAKTAAAAHSSDSHAVVISCLRTLRTVMQSPACRSSLLSESGAELIQQLLQDTCKQLERLQAGGADQEAETQAQQQLAAAAAALTEAASWQDEEAKCRWITLWLAFEI